MSTFPLELIRAVVDNIVSTSELKTLRKVSRTFNTLATPGVFRVLHVTVLSDSVQRLESVHKSDVLRHFVEEVVFQYADTESDDEDIESEASDSETRSVKVTRVEDLEGDDKWKGYRDEELRAYEAEQDETTDDESTTDGSEGGNSDGGSTERDEEFVEEVNFAQLFGRSTPQDPGNLQQSWPALFRLDKFTALHTVRFSFHPTYEEEMWCSESYKPSTHFCIQKSVLASLTNEPHPSTVKHLSLTNVIGADDGAFETSSFEAIVSSLQSLSISTISEDYYDPEYDPRWHQHFWLSVIPERFLVPAQSSLTSLSLGSDIYIGPIADFDINNHYFPHLKSLRLQRFMFDWFDVPGFIIKHKSTLHRLELHDNGMFHDDDSDANPPYWSDVWKQFQVELTHLEEIVVQRSDNPGWDSQLYINLDGLHTLELDREVEEDAEALKKLQASVELRRPQRPRALTFLDRWLIRGKETRR